MDEQVDVPRQVAGDADAAGLVEALEDPVAGDDVVRGGGEALEQRAQPARVEQVVGVERQDVLAAGHGDAGVAGHRQPTVGRPGAPASPAATGARRAAWRRPSAESSELWSSTTISSTSPSMRPDAPTTESIASPRNWPWSNSGTTTETSGAAPRHAGVGSVGHRIGAAPVRRQAQRPFERRECSTWS